MRGGDSGGAREPTCRRFDSLAAYYQDAAGPAFRHYDCAAWRGRDVIELLQTLRMLGHFDVLSGYSSSRPRPTLSRSDSHRRRPPAWRTKPGNSPSKQHPDAALFTIEIDRGHADPICGIELTVAADRDSGRSCRTPGR